MDKHRNLQKLHELLQHPRLPAIGDENATKEHATMRGSHGWELSESRLSCWEEETHFLWEETDARVVGSQAAAT